MKALILAGGSGTRLWPLSRSDFPKQFLRFGKESSFLQKTIARTLNLVSPADLFIITSKAYLQEVIRQANEIDPLLERNILVEPSQKNTAPAIAWAFHMIAADLDEIFLISPADHLISPATAFCAHMQRAEALAQKGFLVTCGIRPTCPETGYGYIQAQESSVKKFVEKPSLRTAQEFLESGDYFWNAGIFLFSKKTFSEEAKLHCPALLSSVFEEMPSLSIDYALLEKSTRMGFVPLDLSWSDIGSWQNIYEMLEKDASQNVLEGDVIAIDTTNSLILAESRLVSSIGLDSVIVIETQDAVLIAHKQEVQKVKEIVSRLKTLGKKQAHEHCTTKRPWGAYTVLMEGERYKIKKITVDPKQKLSLQMHYHRSEHWVVVSGTAKVTIANQERIIHEGESIFVPKSSIHRVENPGKVPLEIIEVQVGEYLGEDDIVRLEDVYNRLNEEEAFRLLQNQLSS